MSELDKTGDFLFYQGKEGTTKVQVILGDETVWATQKSMSEIFGVGIPAVNKHLSNIFESGELEERSVISKMEMTANDGKIYKTKFYNLDAIISVGYRVNSSKATQFRIWATKTLKDYLIKGFALDDERLKQGENLFGKDYFDDLLERIREIRASERRFYQKITDLYATAVDYDPKAQVTRSFFATVQNKLEFAITHHTAPEIIKSRADSRKPNMGLTSWKNEKKGGKILKSDVSVAKNYLSQEEISELNRIVAMYLDYAENQASKGRVMNMKDWADKLDAFLLFNEYDLLKDAGKMRADVARKFAEEEFEKFRVQQDREYLSDFDKMIQNLQTNRKK